MAADIASRVLERGRWLHDAAELPFAAMPDVGCAVADLGECELQRFQRSDLVRVIEARQRKSVGGWRGKSDRPGHAETTGVQPPEARFAGLRAEGGGEHQGRAKQGPVLQYAQQRRHGLTRLGPATHATDFGSRYPNNARVRLKCR